MNSRMFNARNFAAVAVTASLLAFSAAGSGAADNPFTQLIGNWAGSGKITVSNGSNERIRCRGMYRPADKGGLGLNLRCASDSYKFELASDIAYEGNGNITGSWNEASRGIFGTLAGRATAGLVQANASSVGFSATLLIRTVGNSQTVTMRSPGSEISEVSITLMRGK
jgi:hypothetical protein